MKKLCLVFIILISRSTINVNAQLIFPYQHTANSDYISTFTISLNLLSSDFKNNIKPLTIEEIHQLNRNKVPVFDRFAINNYSVKSAKISDYALFSSLILSTATSFVLPKFSQKGNLSYFHMSFTLMDMFLIMNNFCIDITDLSKAIILRPRPFVYNSDTTFDKFSVDARFSFFSGHTSITAANSFFIAKLFYDFFPDSKWKKYVLLSAAILPAYVSYLRVNAGKHFLSDVVTGYFFGALCGWFFPEFYKIKPAEKRVSILPFKNNEFTGLSAHITF